MPCPINFRYTFRNIPNLWGWLCSKILPGLQLNQPWTFSGLFRGANGPRLGGSKGFRHPGVGQITQWNTIIWWDEHLTSSSHTNYGNYGDMGFTRVLTHGHGRDPYVDMFRCKSSQNYGVIWGIPVLRDNELMGTEMDPCYAMNREILHGHLILLWRYFT